MEDSIFWRVVLTGLITILSSIIYSPEFQYLLLLWIVFFITSFFVIKESDVKKIVEFIMSDVFTEHFGYIYKCIIVITSLTIFSALVVIVGIYELSSDTPVNLLIFLFFVFYSSIVYFLRNKKIPFCGKKEKLDA